MRAWQVSEHGEPHDAIRLVDLDPPPLGPGQVRIAVRAAAVGLPDVFMCRGTYPLTPAGVFVPGQEVAGEVVEVGAGADFAVGTRVMAITDFVHGHGGFAEQTIADADNVYEIPACLSEADAAGFLIAYQTAWIGLVQRARLTSGDTVLVLGATGGTGAAAVQLASALGARVIGVVNGIAKVAHCRALGATDVIDRSEELVSTAARRLTDGRGATIVYDPVGGAVANDALRCVANGGQFLLVGFASGTWPTIEAHNLLIGNFSAVGVYAGASTRAERIEMLAEMTALVEKGALRPGVTRSAFDDLPAALTRVAASSVQGRMVAVREQE
jgi:NADPH2:quinone reductase